MKNHLLISLKSDTGKSTSLLNFLYYNKERYKNICGYTTRRVFKDGNVYGYSLIEINSALELYSSNGNTEKILKSDFNDISQNEIFLKTHNCKYIFDDQIFEKYFFRCLECKNPDLIVIDEIGGKELLNQTVLKKLTEIFNSKHDLILVYKIQEQFQNMVKKSNLRNLELIEKRKKIEKYFSNFTSISDIKDSSHLNSEILESYLLSGENNG